MKKQARVAPRPKSWHSLPWLCWLFFWLALACSNSVIQAADTVAVLNFSVLTAESNRWSWAEDGLADLLQIELQRQGVVLLDRDAIHAVLNEQRLTANGQITTDRLTIANLLNAQYLITGKVVPLDGGRFRIEAGAFSVESVETGLTASGEGDFPKELSRVVQDVAKQIAKKLPTHSSGLTDKTQTITRAPKPESLIMFYRGLNACASGQPGWGAAYFMNAASLDSDFTVPVLWEIKAYEMERLPELAAIRREEMADVLKHLGVETAGRTNLLTLSSKPVLAVLNPVVTAGTGIEATSLAADLTHALLATDQVRVFAFEGIGSAIAEQDLRLSSFFANQRAPRYGRWLASDGLVLGRVSPAKRNLVSLVLSLVNPVNASVMARVQRTGSPTVLPTQIPAIVGELLTTWTNRLVIANTSMETPETSTNQSNNVNTDLRPIYRGLVAALAQVRREPGKSDSHRALANAFAATGRTRLAAYEIEQCLKTLDIHAPHADTTYLGTHRWLFWEPSPASGAVGLVDQRLIDHLIDQLLTTYPDSLAAGCMRYNLAVTAWKAENWREAATQAEQSRQIMQPIIAQYDRKNTTVNGGELDCEIAAATYFLEGASLGKLSKPEEAGLVFHQGLDFMETFKVRDFCLPMGPFIGDFFGTERVYGYGGDSPGIRTRLEQALSSFHDNSTRLTGEDLITQARETVAATKKLASHLNAAGSIDGPSSIQAAWLQSAKKISDLLEQVPPADNTDLCALLTEAQYCISAAYGAPAASKRPIVEKCVATFLKKRGTNAADTNSLPSLAKTSDTIVRIYCLYLASHSRRDYEDAGWEEDAWSEVKPLFLARPTVDDRVKLLQLLVAEGTPHHFKFDQASKSLLDGIANVSGVKQPGVKETALGDVYFQNHRYQDALDCYSKAVAQGATVAQCSGLGTALLEVALEKNRDQPGKEIETLRRQLGFPPVEASWVDWFTAGRKYQTSHQYDIQKAAACYRGALNFLEHPEQMGIYHLEKQPKCDHIALRWGPSLSEVDLLWSENYNKRWCNAAYYLAHCLIELDQKEEAAQWLRQIAIKEGGDTIFLLTTGNWNGGSGQEVQLGVRAAELLKQLHQETGLPKFGETDGPYKRPGYGIKARSFSELPSPAAPNPDILHALTNLLAKAAYNSRDEKNPNPQLQAFLQHYGHDAVPALLSLLPRAGELWDEPTLGWLLGQTATSAEAPYVVAACKQHWGLIAGAKKLDFDATAEVLAEEWRSQSESGFVHFKFIFAILDARLRPLYPLVIDHIAEKKANHHSVIFRMDEVVREEKSDELESAFREALSQCLKLKLMQNENYEMPRISKIALRHGVSEAIDGFLVCDGSSPEKLRADLGSVLDLPANDNEVITFLRANSSRWAWHSDRNKFEPAVPANF